MDREIGFGVIGAGGIARNAHLPSLKRIPEARIIAVCRRTEEKVRSVAEQFGARDWYTDYNELLEQDNVEVVIISTPPKFHAEIGIAAAEAGKHILCEKPLARTLDEADRMIQAARAGGVKLGVAEMKRFNPGFRKAKSILEEGVIGRPFMTRYHNSYYEPHVRKSWWVDPEMSGGGEMMNELTHQVNTLRWMLGEVTEVSAMSNHPWGPPPEDNAIVTLRFEDSTIAVVTISWMNKEYNLTFPAPLDHAWDERIDIFGTEGAIRIHTPFTYWRVPIELGVYTEKDVAGFNRGWNLVRCPETEHYVEQLRHFIRCIRGQEACEVSGEEGRADLAVVRAAMESADTGHKVSLR